MLIDTHAHLDGETFAGDLDALVQRAAEADVKLVVSAGQNEATSAAGLELAGRHPNILPAVGVHPHEAASAGGMEWLQSSSAAKNVVAIGEIGLDYHYDFAPRKVQREVFVRQLDLAMRRDLPVIMHCREAEDDLAEVLREHFKPSARGVIHCFTGDYETGKAFIDEFGVWLGLGGAITFKNAARLADAAARLPLERLVLETDCPYMAPVPHRGKRNEPAFVALICKRLAELRNESMRHVADCTTANALRLFPKARLALNAARNGFAPIRSALSP